MHVNTPGQAGKLSHKHAFVYAQRERRDKVTRTCTNVPIAARGDCAWMRCFLEDSRKCDSKLVRVGYPAQNMRTIRMQPRFLCVQSADDLSPREECKDEAARWQTFSVDVRDLLELERSLERDGKVVAAAEVEKVGRVLKHTRHVENLQAGRTKRPVVH
eukprot:6177417-Pleurochrysis_carterae.AAC.10